MTHFDKDNFKRNIANEFESIRQFHFQFRHLFSEVLFKIIGTYFNSKTTIDNSSTIINAYAGHLIDVIESVIEKDKNYSEYRLLIELNRMKKVINKINKPKAQESFINEIEHKTKLLAVNYFPEIINFNANGFRLLDTNLKVFVRDFITDFNFDLKKHKNYMA